MNHWSEIRYGLLTRDQEIDGFFVVGYASALQGVSDGKRVRGLKGAHMNYNRYGAKRASY
jgi:hypothetical protein